MVYVDGQRKLLIIFWSLLFLGCLAFVDFAIVLALFVQREADSTVSTSLILIFLSVRSKTLFVWELLTLDQSLVSVVYIILHLGLAHRLRRSGHANGRSMKLESCLLHIPRLLIVLWMAASAAGLVVAARQPTCYAATVAESSWQAGLACELHRSATGIAVCAL